MDDIFKIKIIIIIIGTLIYMRSLQENNKTYEKEKITEHKAINQNTTIIYLLFVLIITTLLIWKRKKCTDNNRTNTDKN